MTTDFMEILEADKKAAQERFDALGAQDKAVQKQQEEMKANFDIAFGKLTEQRNRIITDQVRIQGEFQYIASLIAKRTKAPEVVPGTEEMKEVIPAGDGSKV